MKCIDNNNNYFVISKLSYSAADYSPYTFVAYTIKTSDLQYTLNSKQYKCTR